MSRSQADDTDATELMLMVERGLDLDVFWRTIFDSYDYDNDGRISSYELKALIQSTSAAQHLSEDAVQRAKTWADENISGSLNFEEFKAIINSPELESVFGKFMSRAKSLMTSYARAINTPPPVPTAARSRKDESSCWPPPLFMILISLLEVGLFSYDAAHGNTAGNGTVGSIFHFHPEKREQAWRFITYMLVHSSYAHLILNVMVQLFFGAPLERDHRWSVALVYLAGVTAGSLAFSLAEPEQPLVGASAGVTALLTAHIANVIMNWSEMPYAKYQMAVYLTLTSLAMGSAIYDLYWGLNRRVGHVAHLAGAITGLLVGIGVLRNFKVHQWEKWIWWTAMVLFFILMAVGILANILWIRRFNPNYHKYVITASDVIHYGRNASDI